MVSTKGLTVKNVAQADLDKAVNVYRTWHKFDPTKVDDGEISFPEKGAELHVLGKVTRLDYTSDKWNKDREVYYYHHFKRNRPYLACDDAGNLYLLGYIQVTPRGIDDWTKKQPPVSKLKMKDLKGKAVSALGILEMIEVEDLNGERKALLFGDRWYVAHPDKDWTYITEPIQTKTSRSNPLASIGSGIGVAVGFKLATWGIDQLKHFFGMKDEEGAQSNPKLNRGPHPRQNRGPRPTPKSKSKTPRKPAKSKLAQLTPEESKAWEHAFIYYIDEGMGEEKADEEAWKDLVKQFPRLKTYTGAKPNPMRCTKIPSLKDWVKRKTKRGTNYYLTQGGASFRLEGVRGGYKVQMKIEDQYQDIGHGKIKHPNEGIKIAQGYLQTCGVPSTTKLFDFASNPGDYVHWDEAITGLVSGGNTDYGLKYFDPGWAELGTEGHLIAGDYLIEVSDPDRRKIKKGKGRQRKLTIAENPEDNIAPLVVAVAAPLVSEAIKEARKLAKSNPNPIGEGKTKADLLAMLKVSPEDLKKLERQKKDVIAHVVAMKEKINANRAEEGPLSRFTVEELAHLLGIPTSMARQMKVGNVPAMIWVMRTTDLADKLGISLVEAREIQGSYSERNPQAKYESSYTGLDQALKARERFVKEYPQRVFYVREHQGTFDILSEPHPWASRGGPGVAKVNPSMESYAIRAGFPPFHPNPLPMGFSPLTPAYGRDYRTIEDAQADFDAGKDFKTPGMGYVSKSEIIEHFPEVKKIQVRYDRLKNTDMLEVRQQNPAEEYVFKGNDGAEHRGTFVDIGRWWDWHYGHDVDPYVEGFDNWSKVDGSYPARVIDDNTESVLGTIQKTHSNPSKTLQICPSCGMLTEAPLGVPCSNQCGHLGDDPNLYRGERWYSRVQAHPEDFQITAPEHLMSEIIDDFYERWKETHGPWSNPAPAPKCTSPSCPYFGKPMVRTSGGYYRCTQDLEGGGTCASTIKSIEEMEEGPAWEKEAYYGRKEARAAEREQERWRTNPADPRVRYEKPKYGKYYHEKIGDVSELDPRSIRTVTTKTGHRVRIGCPKGEWDPEEERCKTGTFGVSVLHPERETRKLAARGTLVQKKNPSAAQGEARRTREQFRR